MPPLSTNLISSSSYSVAIGNQTHNPRLTSIAIGGSARVMADECIAIGQNAIAQNKADIQIGSKEITENQIWINNVNIREMQSRIDQLEEIVEKQNKLIEAMWYAPGMPGYQEGKEMWDTDTSRNVNSK